MRPRLFSLLFACALPFTFSACTQRDLGSETRGKNVDAARGRDVTVIAPERRSDRPRFEGPTLDGKRLSSADLRGSVVVVNFWASWCGECRSEQTSLEKSYRAYKSRGVRFVGINFREPDQAAARAYIDEFHVTYPSIWNPDTSLAAPFRIIAPPSTFILDTKGRIAARIVGTTGTDKDLNAVLDQVIAS
ncbi:MAG: TlpA disulfide reductase family protein [Actinomycetota bacterium]